MFVTKERLSELVLILLVCLAPWAYGSVEAWAELWLYAGIALLTLLDRRRSPSATSRDLGVRLPGLAIIGLVVLALFQAMPLPGGMAPWIASSTTAERARLLPTRSEAVLGDTEGAVGDPATTLSLEPDATLQTAARLCAAWLLFQFVLGMNGRPGVSLRFARALVFNATLLALFAIVQGLAWNGRIYWIRPAHASMNSWSVGGPFLSHSHLAAYLNMGLGLALCLLMEGPDRRFLRRGSTSPWTAYAAAIIAVGVISSHSRSGFLGLVSAGVLLAFLLRGRLIRLGFGLAVVLALIGLCLVVLGAVSPFGSRLATIFDIGNDGYVTRLELWQGAARAWWARPFWGCGFGGFPVAIIPFLRHSRGVFFARAENEYIDMLVEGGAIGLMLAFGFLVSIGTLARRALRELPIGPERGVVGGAVFGLIALAVQSCADFAPHVPAVGVLAIVLCGLIARRGGTADSSLAEPATGRFMGFFAVGRWLTGSLRWLGPVVLSVFLVLHAARDAWIEERLARAGLPAPGTYMTTLTALEPVSGLPRSREVARIGILTDVGGLEPAAQRTDEYQAALRDVLRRRPNWSEGHVRLGLAHLELYRQMIHEPRDPSRPGLANVDRMADPIGLLRAIHEQGDHSASLPGKLAIKFVEPAVCQLAAAARCFLEARRCSPFLALPHAELAALDYMLTNGDSASAYAMRAFSLSGNDGQMLIYLAQLALRAGDRKRAAECWRRSLKVDPSSWMEVADAARQVLSSDEILSEVATDGRDAIRFADRLFTEAHDRPVRSHFLEVAVDRFATGHETITAEQLFLEAHALAGLDQTVRAGKQMETALTLEPAHAAWREEYIGWLLRWGRADEAHAEALKGRYFSPESNAIREAVDRTAQVLAGDDAPP